MYEGDLGLGLGIFYGEDLDLGLGLIYGEDLRIDLVYGVGLSLA